MKINVVRKTDQWNADDFVGGPRTFTITAVKVGSAEQQYDISVEGDKRFWRPPTTMLLLLIAIWGDETSEWIGRRITLYRDPSVKFGPDVLGGVRISHMSDLPGGKTFSERLTITRGKRALFTVEPLAPLFPIDTLRAEYKTATPERQVEIMAEVEALKAAGS